MSAGAGAERQRRERAEEEEMTSYRSDDPRQDWEFKILRSMSNAFRKPEQLAAILEQEARAGWMLVEKFDNRRIRLKRSVTYRKDDRSLDFDPYRSYVGSAENTVLLIIVAVSLAVGIAMFVIAAQFG